MSDENDTFLDKIKTMPIEELVKYESVAITMDRVINVTGISCCLIMFFFPVIIALLVCIPAVCFLANMGTGIRKSLEEIRRYMAKLQKT